ncbi:hypothetical protein Q8F55_008574 [Vanrija albida]|uniref:Uncharacterized protein n=1 Tax=Vanrija albida TaxID=181172 RepID=A0ABR3PS62_9TREE
MPPRKIATAPKRPRAESTPEPGPSKKRATAAAPEPEETLEQWEKRPAPHRSKKVDWGALNAEQVAFVDAFKPNYQLRISRLLLALVSPTALVVRDEDRCLICARADIDLPCVVDTDEFKCLGCAGDEGGCNFPLFMQDERDIFLEDLADMGPQLQGALRVAARAKMEDAVKRHGRGRRARARHEAFGKRRAGDSAVAPHEVTYYYTYDSSNVQGPPFAASSKRYWVARAAEGQEHGASELAEGSHATRGGGCTQQ